MTIYLYKKTHNITGLKYLGKTWKLINGKRVWIEKDVV
jgi:hypothetical protein